MCMNPIPPAQQCYYIHCTCSCLWTFHSSMLKTLSLWVVLASIHLDFDTWQLFYVAKNLVPEIFYSSGLAYQPVFPSWVFKKIFSFWGEEEGVWSNWQFCWLCIIVMLIMCDVPVFPGISSVWSPHSHGCLSALSQTDELCAITKMKNANVLYNSGSSFTSMTISGKFPTERILDDCTRNISCTLEMLSFNGKYFCKSWFLSINLVGIFATHSPKKCEDVEKYSKTHFPPLAFTTTRTL